MSDIKQHFVVAGAALTEFKQAPRFRLAGKILMLHN